MRISDWSSDVCSCDLRQGGKPGVDFLRREELLRARPCRVRDAYVLGIEFDVERREIELEIAADIDLALKLRRRETLERAFQETALGDEQYQPDCEQDQQDDRDRPDRDPQRQIGRAHV